MRSRSRSSCWRGRGGGCGSRARSSPWLHAVACRVAADARKAAARRRARHERMRNNRPAAADPGLPGDGGEEAAILHEEIGRLSEALRAAVVLCDLQGLSHQAAARLLGWPVGTVKSRQLLRRGAAAVPAGPAGPGPLGRGAGGVVAGRGGRRRGGPRPGRCDGLRRGEYAVAARRRPAVPEIFERADPGGGPADGRAAGGRGGGPGPDARGRRRRPCRGSGDRRGRVGRWRRRPVSPRRTRPPRLAGQPPMDRPGAGCDVPGARGCRGRDARGDRPAEAAGLARFRTDRDAEIAGSRSRPEPGRGGGSR